MNCKRTRERFTTMSSRIIDMSASAGPDWRVLSTSEGLDRDVCSWCCNRAKEECHSIERTHCRDFSHRMA